MTSHTPRSANSDYRREALHQGAHATRVGKRLAVLLAVVFGLLLIVGGQTARLADLPELLAKSLEAIGIVLVSSVVISFLYNIHVRRSLAQEIQDEMRRILGTELSTIEHFRTSGLIRMHDVLPTEEIKQLIKNAKRIRILQTGIAIIVELEPVFRHALQRSDCRLEVLMLDPQGEHCVQRSVEQEFNDKAAIRTLIEFDLVQLSRLWVTEGVPRDNVQVRLYDGTSTLSVYWIDDTAFCGIYWRGRSSDNGPHFQVRLGKNALAQAIEDHWNRIWAGADPYVGPSEDSIPLKHQDIETEDLPGGGG